MKFSCHFVHKDTDERKSIVVALSAEECRTIESIRKNDPDQAELVAMSFALLQAYGKVSPINYNHVDPPSEIHPS